MPFDSAFEGDSAVIDDSLLVDFIEGGSLTPGDATVLLDEVS